MEVLPHHPLIIMSQESMKKIRQLYGIEDVKRIRESVTILQNWLEMQPHLADGARYLSSGLLERMFIISKGSVEATKNRLERMMTTRGMIPELSLNRSIDEFEAMCDLVYYVALPKLHPVDQSRINVTQFMTDKVDSFSLLSYFRYCFMLGEYRVNYDYSVAERTILDLKNVNIGFLGKINPVVVKKAEVLCTEGFGTKIKGIHILNAPPFVEKLLFILKQALREKVANRVHVHNTNEDLHKHIPKEILPAEYGGDEQSCSKLNEQWRDVLRTDAARRLVRETEKIVSDESKRQTAKFNEEYMGMPGSFRTLTVD